MKKHSWKRFRLLRANDRADAVAVGSILMMPLLFMSMGFSIDMSKANYTKDMVTNAAQHAVTESVRIIDIEGDLTSGSVAKFVTAYKDNIRMQTTGQANPFITRTGECSKVDPDGDGVKNKTAPYMEITLSSRRGQGSDAGAPKWISENYATPGLTGWNQYYTDTRYRVITATVWDTSRNLFWGMAGIPCQTMKSEVSAITFGIDDDVFDWEEEGTAGVCTSVSKLNANNKWQKIPYRHPYDSVRGAMKATYAWTNATAEIQQTLVTARHVCINGSPIPSPDYQIQEGDLLEYMPWGKKIRVAVKYANDKFCNPMGTLTPSATVGGTSKTLQNVMNVVAGGNNTTSTISARWVCVNGVRISSSNPNANLSSISVVEYFPKWDLGTSRVVKLENICTPIASIAPTTSLDTSLAPDIFGVMWHSWPSGAYWNTEQPHVVLAASQVCINGVPYGEEGLDIVLQAGDIVEYPTSVGRVVVEMNSAWTTTPIIPTGFVANPIYRECTWNASTNKITWPTTAPLQTTFNPGNVITLVDQGGVTGAYDVISNTATSGMSVNVDNSTVKGIVIRLWIDVQGKSAHLICANPNYNASLSSTPPFPAAAVRAQNLIPGDVVYKRCTWNPSTNVVSWSSGESVWVPSYIGPDATDYALAASGNVNEIGFVDVSGAGNTIQDYQGFIGYIDTINGKPTYMACANPNWNGFAPKMHNLQQFRGKKNVTCNFPANGKVSLPLTAGVTNSTMVWGMGETNLVMLAPEQLSVFNNAMQNYPIANTQNFFQAYVPDDSNNAVVWTCKRAGT